MNSQRGKIKNKVLNILLSFFVLFLLFSILEIVLRTTNLFNASLSWSEPNPIIGYKFIPGSNYWYFKENDHPITGRINSFGWRDKEWSLTKSSGTYRIAFLGDSFVEAFQIEQNRTFLALSEHNLKDKYSSKFEFMNFGRSGFTQTEEFLVLKNEIARFSPDMVLLFFFPGNDINDISRETSYSPLRPFYNISKDGKLVLETDFTKTAGFKIRAFINLVKRYSVLISFIAERYNSYERQKSIKVNISGSRQSKINDYLTLCTATPDATLLRNYQLNKMLIKAMSSYCEEKGIILMLVTIDIPAYVTEENERLRSIDPNFNADFFEDDLGNYAKLLGIEYLGLQRIFRKQYQTTGDKLHWDHWNYEGHIVVANALSDKLSSIIKGP